MEVASGNSVGRNYQAIPIAITVEGANILTRSLIVFGQGAMRCHPQVINEMQAVFNEDANQGARDFDKAFMDHLSHTFKNALRSTYNAVGGSRIVNKRSQTVCSQYELIKTRRKIQIRGSKKNHITGKKPQSRAALPLFLHP